MQLASTWFGRNARLARFRVWQLALLLIFVERGQTRSTSSLKEAIATELLTKPGDQHLALTDLGVDDDDDAPEELDLPSPPKARALTKFETALLKKEHPRKVNHEQKAGHKQKVLKKKTHNKHHHVLSKPASPPTRTPKPREATKPKDQLAVEPQGEDLQQLGGQLQNLMSELNDQTSGDEKANLNQVNEQSIVTSSHDDGEERPASPSPVEASSEDKPETVAEKPEAADPSNPGQTTVENAATEENAVSDEKIPTMASPKDDAQTAATSTKDDVQSLPVSPEEDTQPVSTQPASTAPAENIPPVSTSPTDGSPQPDNSPVEKLASEEANKDDAAIASDDRKQQESENAVDGAMAYIRTRLASEEHKGLRLRQMLAQSVHENQKLRLKVEQMHTQAFAEEKNKNAMSAIASKKLQQVEVELSEQKHRADNAEIHAQNASHAATIGEKTMKLLAKHLKESKSQVAALLINIANASHEKEDLSRRLRSSTEHENAESTELAATKQELAKEAWELADMKSKFAKLEAVKAVEDKSVVTLDQQKDLLEQRQKSSTKRDQILHKENNVLKTQLAAEVKREEQLREMWSKESEAFTWQLRAERANATEALADLERARGEFRELRKRVQSLREKASIVEQAKRIAEDAAYHAKFALSQAEAQNKQLRGSVPWLEAQVTRQRQISTNATAQMKKAISERDTLRAILAEAQKNIVQLQGQYADALRALVVAQAGGGDTDATNQQKANTAVGGTLIDTFANLNLGSSGLGLPTPGDAADETSLVETGASRQNLHHDSKIFNMVNVINSK